MLRGCITAREGLHARVSERMLTHGLSDAHSFCKENQLLPPGRPERESSEALLQLGEGQHGQLGDGQGKRCP